MVVRHGQATHNIKTFREEDRVMTEEEVPSLNSPLTKEGKRQAGLVAKRLAHTKFHLGFSSDLERAWDTVQAIVGENYSLGQVEECRMLRERNFLGGFNSDRVSDSEVIKALQKSEKADIKNRELLVWRIPGGESVVDLRTRVRGFLSLVQSRALALEVEAPTILAVTHGLWMGELYHILAELTTAQTGVDLEAKLKTPNTGVDQYTLVTKLGEQGEPELEQVVFTLTSCGRHLESGDTI